MSIFGQISSRIIKEQELIIGPLAWQEASKVPGLKVINQQNGEIDVSGDEKAVIDNLVAQYAKLFGQVSTEACKEAVQDLIVELPQEQVPTSLR